MDDALLAIFRGLLAIPEDSELFFHEHNQPGKCILAERTASGDLHYRYLTYKGEPGGRFMMLGGGPIELSEEAFRALKKLEGLIREAKEREPDYDLEGWLYVLDPAEHPDLFVEGDYDGHIYQFARNEIVSAIHQLEDELKLEGEDLNIGRKYPDTPKLWLMRHKSRIF